MRSDLHSVHVTARHTFPSCGPRVRKSEETLDNDFMLERMSGLGGPVGSIRSRMCS
nr:MAG TPA: hypothetical protein [Caudoviricetes sp.]